MKNRLVTVLVVLSMLFVFVGSAAAAPQSVGVRYLGGVWAKGQVIFTFQVDENLGDKWIGASVSWDGGSAQITCNQEEDIVRCVAPADAADKKVHVTFQGAGYVDFVKSQEESKNCYPAFDYDGSPKDPDNWYDFGPYCQDEPADFGATEPTSIYNPYYDGTFEYWYWYENCYGDSFGDGFYFNCWDS